MQNYDHKKIEKKWKEKWQKTKIFDVDLDKVKNPYYLLMMFPYPSAEGMHVGSMFTFSGVDTYGRLMRMKGYDVFEPIGLDGFGIHSENYAIKIGEHIKTVSDRTEKRFYEQLHDVGNAYDWSRTVETYKPNYYKWTQWLFLEMYKAGLAYRKSATVNWCPSCKTVLSDEQVIKGKCERCESEVIHKDQEQWFFKITDYAERLLKNLEWIKWDEGVKLGQKNWIGKKEGIEIDYKVDGSDQIVTVFTTRPDTNFGATFIVVAPEYKGLDTLIKKEAKQEAEEYIQNAKSKTTVERMQDSKEKTGVFTGSYAINELTGYKMPIYIADYVLTDFGTGAVVGVPAHDRRDFDFAVKYNLDIIKVVEPRESRSYLMGYKDGVEDALNEAGFKFEKNENNALEVHVSNDKIDDYIEIVKEYLKEGFWNEVAGARDVFIFNDAVIELNPDSSVEIMKRCKWLLKDIEALKNPYEMIIGNSFYSDFYVFEDEGQMINSEFLNGLHPHDAIEKMMDYMEKKGYARRVINYKLRDWCVSRQRYWGPPIPMINCEKCGWVPVDYEDLPVLLPDIEEFEDILPDGSGKSPLAKQDSFVHTKCPKCGGDAKRETDVLDPFVDSCWYYLRYPSTEFDDLPFDQERTKKWLPVNKYIGGKEHTVLHLLYSRFVTMVLHDQGLLDFEEPFEVFDAHGMITKDGAKMSKSRGNIVVPDEWVERVGADTMRMYFRFMGEFSQGGDWRDSGILGMHRFVSKLWKLNQEVVKDDHNDSTNTLRKLNKTIKKVGEDIEALHFNTAVSAIMEFVNAVVEEGAISKESWKKFILILAPFMPFITEEFWEVNGGEYSVHNQAWPEYDEKLIVDDEVTIVIQVNGKLRDNLVVAKGLEEAEVVEMAKKSEKVSKYIENGYKKAVFVKDRLVNFVV